jgi:hypothetical protein
MAGRLVGFAKAGRKEQSMGPRYHQRLVLITVMAVASAVGGCACGHPSGGDGTLADPARVIVGEWNGTAPCDGGITFRSDGTFERRHYSPGDNRVEGTWALRRHTSPPTLSLTCEKLDGEDVVGRVVDVTLVRVDAKELVYRFSWDPDLGPFTQRYERDVSAAQRP